MAELTVPSIDFSSIGELGNVYRKANADAARQQTLASLGQGPLDQAAAQRLIASGDLSLANLGVGLANTNYQHGRDATNDARSAKNDAFSQSLQLQQLALSKRAAARADEGPVEQGQQRAEAALKMGLKPGTPEYTNYALTGRLPDSFSSGGQPEVGLNPAYGVGADGRPAAIQFSKNGKAVQTQLPEGFQLQKEPIRIDSGTHITLLDPITRQTIGTVPKNLAGVEVAKAEGDATGAAQVALPTVISNSQSILKTLDGIENHPGKKYSLGMYSKAPTIPGTSQADFRANMDQLNGQTFLQAYQTLKGGGAITDIEGAKGSNALARMQTSQSQESFDSALKDFKDVVKSGMLRASAKARGPGSQTQGITQQQYDALPSGSPFTAPDGTQRIKP